MKRTEEGASTEKYDDISFLLNRFYFFALTNQWPASPPSPQWRGDCCRPHANFLPVARGERCTDAACLVMLGLEM